MKPKQFAILAAAAAVSLVAAVATYLAAVPWTAEDKGPREALMPALLSRGSELAAIEISREKETVRLASKDGKWVYESGEGYPVDEAKARELVLALTEARLVERKTAVKDRHELLGLGDHTAPGTSARLLKLLDAKGDVLGEIVLGRPAFDMMEASKGGTYVRRPSEDQTWLADRPLQVSLSIRDWVKTRLIDRDVKSIKSIRIEREGEAPIEISRTGDGNQHELAAMPEGKKLKYVSAIDDVAEAISLIEFRSVRRQSGKSDALPLKGRATFETDNGFKPSIEFRGDGSKVWIRITATGGDAAKNDVEDIVSRASGWEFEVPQTELNAILVKLSDLIEDAPA
jgi:hypothetical protein